MKLNNSFITHDDGDQKLLVSTGASEFSGLVRSNETAGFIIGCLENETTEAEIIEKMQQKYDGPKEAMERDVKKIIGQLRKIGALDE
ncbi:MULTISPECIES: PqqD family protein [Ruminococcus]|uniref:Coenzyme PQQ synthesis protein D (PqqD) n=1 Tax=Ruminococcus flavefaciens TaxID=1265 RepID=A0A1M7LRL2_RUMFL|nr:MULTISPECIES: PqqD family protein [Ruminococcus]MCR4794056.1 PqqD family protein [Ruminococcus sp.]SHM80695.1 Coenzyme PQQ synthesis protein D (PqqD) [Ruminococcus flavefaciens]